MTLAVTTVERVAARLDFDPAGKDAKYAPAITEIIGEVSQLFEQWMGRKIMSEERVEFFSPRCGQTVVTLAAAPVDLGETFEVRSDGDRTFGATTVVDATDYVVEDEAGVLRVTGFAPVAAPRTLRVTYTAGMGATTEAFMLAYPAIASVAADEVIRRFKARTRPGAVSISDPSGSVQIEETSELMTRTEGVLTMFRREVMA